jgi:hypothetical protein
LAGLAAVVAVVPAATLHAMTYPRHRGGGPVPGRAVLRRLAALGVASVLVARWEASAGDHLDPWRVAWLAGAAAAGALVATGSLRRPRHLAVRIPLVVVLLAVLPPLAARALMLVPTGDGSAWVSDPSTRAFGLAALVGAVWAVAEPRVATTVRWAGDAWWSLVTADLAARAAVRTLGPAPSARVPAGGRHRA